jgi:dihydropteroate synthase
VRLRARDHEWTFPRERPLLMGILNATPDSVSDRTRHATLEDLVAHGRALHAAGADLVDVGGESGRTDRPPVSADEEIARVEPAIRALSADGVAVSVDTFRAEVAAAALDAGAVLVNDVGGLADPAIAQLAARSGAGLVVMHTRAAPKEASFPGYDDPLADVKAFLEERTRTALDAGVDPEQLVLDPGLDYAKTPEESIEVLRRLGELRALERPLLLAVSNKYFVGMLTGRAPDERLPGTLAALAHGVDQGAAVVRVHDVRAAADHLAVRAALRAGGTPALAGDAADESLKWL